MSAAPAPGPAPAPTPAPTLDDRSLRVLRGAPTAEELAVLTAVLTAVLPAARPTGTPQPAPAPTPVRVRWDRSDADYRSPLAWVA